MPHMGNMILRGGASAGPFYTAHIFKSTGNWVCTAGGTVDILIVGGGGGGGGGSYANGGGGGGAFYEVTRAMTAQTYTCTVGAGGAGSTSGNGSAGGDSKVEGADGDLGHTIKGGGYGGGYPYTGGDSSGTYGGSSGGAGSNSSYGGTAGSLGNAGGGGVSTYPGSGFSSWGHAGGGGGGAGSVGRGRNANANQYSPMTHLSNGGAGKPNTYADGGATASSSTSNRGRWFAGGGGGGHQYSPHSNGGVILDATHTSGSAGWGVTSLFTSGWEGYFASQSRGSYYGISGYGADPNSGGGGGDQMDTSTSGFPVWNGAGGSGIVVIRYASTSGVVASGGDITQTYPIV